jgi:alpha-glucuronidase
MKSIVKILVSFFVLLWTVSVKAEDGSRLWLRYETVSDPELLRTYRTQISGWRIEGNSPTMQIAAKELQQGLEGLLASPVTSGHDIKTGMIIAGTPESSSLIGSANLQKKLKDLGNEGYILLSTKIQGKEVFVITANKETGVLYGVFHFLRLIQTQRSINKLEVINVPKTTLRILDHWDNLDRTVERGYAGFSLWDWQRLPEYISPVYKEYARANASIGINGTVLTNVNANALILNPDYLIKVAALADVFRPYGIRVYLTARFSAPIELGKLKTADPLDPEVIAWWKKKTEEIYRYIPDFGGFLVKANSEGQPGPQNYGRSHADGANMLADAVKPFGGIVMWRAFVYDNNVPDDRAKQAYNEFVPLDGKFRNNVLIQVKNGPIDFQPREPFHPLFGAMPKTPLMMEFQITQEYLGFATHLVYLAPLYQECLESDTWVNGKGSTVAKVIDGSLENHKISGLAGVTNIGNDRNWTGHPFAQANWYAFGRLAWDPFLGADKIADDWIRMTFSNQKEFVDPIRDMMLNSRETAVQYMTPLGLHHIMGSGHHYGPGPWVDTGRADWTSVYYHKADSLGIGFERTAVGSGATGQYADPVDKFYSDLSTCPENLLLWFHHLPWDYRMKSGRILWDELCFQYTAGVNSVIRMQEEWAKKQGMIDEDRFEEVKSLLSIQAKEAKWWRDACIAYFQQFSKRPVPEGLEKPEHSLDYYKNQRFYYVPGN